jgi:hypothetical protein
MGNRKTAVEWFGEKMYTESHTQEEWLKIFEQAKEIEKQQIIEAATWGALHESAEQYYNQTYNNEQSK